MADEFLKVENFAQIRSADIRFGDLTVLVGPQPTGKSLVLQLFKLALDARFVSSMMAGAGLVWRSSQDFIGRYLGEGMEHAWRQDTRVSTHLGDLRLERLPKTRSTANGETVFYVPAHRALLLVDGWPLRFERFKEDTPIVARLFSDALFSLLAERGTTNLFPAPRRLKAPFREIIDDAVFHGGRVQLVEHGPVRRLEIAYGQERDGLPFLTWTAGQREFTPLLLGLYRVLPAGAVARHEPFRWVVIEEPEMGLHPRAIEVVMLIVLELIRRDYRVILSTHSPAVLEVVWGLKRLAEYGASPKKVLEVFDVRRRHDLVGLAERALSMSSRVYSLGYDHGRVSSYEISDLDPGSTNEMEAFWGGLTALGSRLADLVASAKVQP